MEGFAGFITGVIFAFAVSIGTITLIKDNTPKPIDVYRGKTTLEITYKDRVPIDSTVVWKNK